MPAKTKETTEPAVDKTAAELLQNLLGQTAEHDITMKQGLTNLNTLPTFSRENPTFQPVQGKEFHPGVIGFRKSSSGALNIAIACGKAQVRYITLPKFIAMIENLHDKDAASIMLQNFTESDDNRTGRGQVLGRINADSSAITIIQGVTSRIIRGPSDIALFDVYYIDRRDLTAYYLAANPNST